MSELLLVALAGFAASLVDGALGMGFGPTSSSILLGAGLAPSSVSATVNIAKVVTGLASAISHWRFRNIDHRLVLRLALPGAGGAVVGVVVLNVVGAEALTPLLAAILLLVGLRMLLRFSKPVVSNAAEFEDLEHDPDRMPSYDEKGIAAVGAAGGVTNGLVGTWGPVVTPVLMHRGLPPRFAVGSVNTAEVAVAAVSSVLLIGTFGSSGLELPLVLAMLAGGVAGAPVAAWAIRRVPARPLGVGVAAMLLLTNSRQLADWADLGPARWAVYGAVAVLVTLAAVRPRLRSRREAVEALA